MCVWCQLAMATTTTTPLNGIQHGMRRAAAAPIPVGSPCMRYCKSDPFRRRAAAAPIPVGSPRPFVFFYKVDPLRFDVVLV